MTSTGLTTMRPPEAVENRSDFAQTLQVGLKPLFLCHDIPQLCAAHEAADVVEQDMEYLYTDGEFWHFMDQTTFEQKAADEAAVGDAKLWLKEEDVCEITLYNGEPLSVSPPNFVELEIVETDPGLKGDTAGTGGKPATLTTGAVVRVPLFVQTGEIVKVDTRTGDYVGRIKS